MKKPNQSGLLAAFILGLFLHQPLANASDFIDNKPPLAQDPERSGAMIWEKPGLNRAAYTRVMMGPVTIFISPDSEYKGLDADELKTLADTFRAAVTKTLEPEIPLVSQAGPGVVYVRAALVDVDVAKKKRGLLGYTPIGFVIGAAKDAVEGPSVTLKNAALEIEMLDSVSGERLGVLVDKAPTSATEDHLSWDSITKTFELYADRFKSRFEAAK